VTAERPAPTQLDELHAAFRVFSDATATLESQYRALEEHAQRLGRELDAKSRALAASIERQRCLETQALRHSRLAAMGEMAATLAHEVRNPLGAMELHVKLLLEEIADRPDARRLGEQVADGVANLNHLVTNILDYTRLPEPQLATCDLDELLDEALLTAAPALGPAVRVKRRRAPGLAWAVDRGLLTQALLNLLRNAGEAMAGEGVLTLAVEPTRRFARIVVADSGPGIPAGNEESIFAPFFTTKQRGTGLGLAVARAAVAAHGGTLALRSGGAGATFVITVPAPAGADEHNHEGE
jgi:signal transduction histidine kinase